MFRPLSLLPKPWFVIFPLFLRCPVEPTLVLQKYNACLETLDLSRNPCAGPTLEGVSNFAFSGSGPKFV